MKEYMKKWGAKERDQKQQASPSAKPQETPVPEKPAPTPEIAVPTPAEEPGELLDDSLADSFEEEAKEKPTHQLTPYQQRLADSKQQEEEKFKSMILICPNPYCPKPMKKFVKGAGVKYKILDSIIELCSNRCLQDYTTVPQ